MKLNRRNFIGTTALIGTVGPSLKAAESISQTKTIDSKYLDARSSEPPYISDSLAAHAVNISFADLDEATVEKAKHRILDLIGCVIGGAPAYGNAALVESIKNMGGKGESSIIGYPVKGPASQVAMVNAVISRSYDFEVMSVVVEDKQIPSHHSPTTCMTALALAEREQASGKDFITALVVGDDIAARLLAASGLDFGQGWDGAPVYSAFSAAAIAARFLKLSPLQVRDAYGLTLDTIAGSVQNIWDGATDWKLPQGLVARNGIFAAELAKGGWAGLIDPLLAPYGFFSQYTGGCADPDILTSNLGTRFYAEEYFKPYPACAATHSAIESAVELKLASKPDPKQIQEIIIYVPEGLLNVFVAKPFEARRDPHCNANFSLQFAVANVLLHGDIRQEHYAEAAIRSEAITSLVGKSYLQALPVEQTGCKLEIIMENGTVLTNYHDGPPSQYPAEGGSSYEQLLKKFRQQLAFSGFVSEQTTEKLIDRIANLESEADMSEFVELLTMTYL